MRGACMCNLCERGRVRVANVYEFFYAAPHGLRCVLCRRRVLSQRWIERECVLAEKIGCVLATAAAAARLCCLLHARAKPRAKSCIMWVACGWLAYEKTKCFCGEKIRALSEKNGFASVCFVTGE